jgi:tRNA G18 (ribose-2'-O)-methylase SpoU
MYFKTGVSRLPKVFWLAKQNLKLSDLVLSDNPLILVAEAPKKPGNIGALLRTADAANLDAVILQIQK